MVRLPYATLAVMLSAGMVLGGCQNGSNFPLFKKKSGESVETTSVEGGSTRLVERDIEAPEVFQQTDQGLWDGRPSLGGVWVAHDATVSPERVIIRNESNGKFVIGALFKREASNPGPKIQVSSDAAEALGMLAGAPARLNVTALKREEVPIASEVPAGEAPLDAAEPIVAQTLDGDPVTSDAAAAIERSEIASATATPAAPVAPTAAPAPKPTSALDRPYIQIGIFSIKENADNTASMLRGAGVSPEVKEGNSSGKAFWRVVVGPAATSSERAALLKKIQGLGFADAYAVTN